MGTCFETMCYLIISFLSRRSRRFDRRSEDVYISTLKTETSIEFAYQYSYIVLPLTRTIFAKWPLTLFVCNDALCDLTNDKDPTLKFVDMQ